MDGILRENTPGGLGERVQHRARSSARWPAPSSCSPSATAAARAPTCATSRSVLEGLPVSQGDKVRATFMGGIYREFSVVETNPRGPVTDRRHHHGQDQGRERLAARPRGHRRHLRGHRRPAQAGAAHPRDDRAAAALPGALRQPRHRAAEGRPALRPARLRQDADREGAGQRDVRLLHPHRRPRDHGQVLRRVRGAPAQDLRGSAGARARASSSSTRSTPSPRSARRWAASSRSRSASSRSCCR